MYDAYPDGGMAMISTPPALENPHIIQYTFEPHTQTAVYLLVVAILVIIGGWVIDMVIADWKKNYGNDNDKR